MIRFLVAFFVLLLAAQAQAAVTLNGTTGWINVGNDSSLNVTQDVTVAGWVVTTDSSGAVFGKWHYSNNALRQYVLTIGGGKAIFAVRDASGNVGQANSTTSVNDGALHHLVGTYDGTTTTIYVDGTSEATDTTASGNLYAPTGNFGIGLYTNSADVLLAGEVKEVSAWNTALGQTNIDKLYATTLKKFPTQILFANLIGHWALDDGSDGVSGLGQNYVDSSSYGNDGNGIGGITNLAEDYFSYPMIVQVITPPLGLGLLPLIYHHRIQQGNN